MNRTIQTTTPRPVGPVPAGQNAPTNAVPEPYIDKAEVAKRLGRTVRCIDNWMKRGLIPYYKIGRSVSFKWSDVEAQLSQTCRVSRWALTTAFGRPEITPQPNPHYKGQR